MKIGIPREVKPLEGRVALVPEACGDLVRAGHTVHVEAGAGLAAGYADEAYVAHGVRLCPDAASLYAEAELVVKVKEPWGPDLDHLRRDHLLFCFLHLAAEPELARRLMDIGLTAIGFETVIRDGDLPLLAPMSIIAGRIAVQQAAVLLMRPAGGRGVLLGGLGGAGRGRVVVLGAGHAGGAAALLAADMGARVTVLDIDRARLQRFHELRPGITALHAYHERIREQCAGADLLVGAVLRPGHRAPHLVTEDMVRAMPEGSVVVDISIDQGGCVETARPVTWEAPVYRVHGVQHLSVTNLPGAVPRTASQALSSALLPEARRIADGNWEADEALRGAINVAGGEVVHPAVRADLGL
ncbi:MAG: alanine dehydrogenase [Gammaproteobacteria bacterium]|nr:MAG: alanine dehydrogenase [Gammaproteobacteria bacterium]